MKQSSKEEKDGASCNENKVRLALVMKVVEEGNVVTKKATN